MAQMSKNLMLVYEMHLLQWLNTIVSHFEPFEEITQILKL